KNHQAVKMREYQHIGIPTKEAKNNEIYHKEMKYSSTPPLDNEYRIQSHRLDEDCELDPLIKSVTHVAFKVDSIEREIEGKNVILGPYEPIPGYRVAIIEFEGIPLEFIETNLTDEELASYEGELNTGY